MARIGKTKIDGGWAWRWYAKPEPDGRYLALATFFELRSGWGLPRFEWYTLLVHRQLTRAPGLIGYTFRGEFPPSTGPCPRGTPAAICATSPAPRRTARSW